MSVVKPERTSRSGTREYAGVLDPWQTAKLGSRVPGEVALLLVDRGDRFKKGSLLATIAIPGVAEDVRRAAAQEKVARAELALLNDRQERMLAAADAGPPGVIAEGDITRLGSQVTAAQARIGEARATLAGESAMRKDTRVIAPFDGVVVARNADPGSALVVGSPILTVADVSRLRVAIDVPSTDATGITIGQRATVIIPAIGDRNVQATVARFAPVLDPETRTLRVEIDVPNDGTLLAGVPARATLQMAQSGPVLTVPADAIVSGDGPTWLFVVRAGTAHKQQVTVSYDRGPVVEIGAGLADTDQVIIGGRGLLADGSPVEVAK